MFITYSNLQPSWPETSLAEVLHISRIALWRIVLVLVLAVGTAGILGLHSADEVSESRSRFIDAFGSLRISEGRLVGFPYRPLSMPAPPPERIAEAARSFHRWAERRPSSEVAAEMALLRLMEGEQNRAIDYLEEASRESVQGAQLSDLAAAYLEQGLAEEQPFSLLKALEATDRAVRIDPDLSEAWFNRALILEKLQLRGQAIRAWKDALAKERESTWGREIQDRLSRLKEPPSSWDEQSERLEKAVISGRHEEIEAVVRQFPFRARCHGEEERLGLWAKFWLNGRVSEAEFSLNIARVLGKTLKEVHGDRLLSEAVAVIDVASPELRSELAIGHLAYWNGISLLDRNLITEALGKFLEAEVHLDAARSPFVLWANLGTAICQHYQGHYEEALDILVLLRSSLSSLMYPSLAGRVNWVLGLLQMKMLRPSASTESYKAALSIFERLGESENISALHTLIAENFRLRGQMAEVWSHRLAALEAARSSNSSVWTHNALFEASEALVAQKMPRVAFYFQSEMVEHALSAKEPLTITEALIQRGRTFIRIGELESATKDLEAARVWCGRIREVSLHQGTLADVESLAGDLMLRSSPADSLPHWNWAISYYRGELVRYPLPDLFRRRAEAFLRIGVVGHSEADLTQGIKEYQSIRSRLLGDPLQISYFDQSRKIFQSMIELQAFHRRREDSALTWSEKGKALGLLDSLGREPISAKEIQKRLPTNVTVLAFSVLQRRTIAWVVTRDRLEMTTIDISEAALEKQIKALLSALAREDEADFHSTSRSLYELLLKPLEKAPLPGLLVIVPEKSLCSLPFAALKHPRTERFLVEDVPLALAPSASHYVQATERLISLGPLQGRRALVVGNPDLANVARSDLRVLPGAEQEAARIAALYRQPKLLLGEKATETLVMMEAKEAEIVHLAAHSVENVDFPLFSAIFLASSGVAANSDGLLYAHEIYGQHFPRTALLVLAGCDTAAGLLSSSEGAMSFARSFLAAGVPSVAASMWKISDAESVSLLVDFHHEIIAGHTPAEALRLAQTRAIRSSEAGRRWPGRWASFIVMGGS